uniref:Uncharacterized protein n=1 Tax=Romanomermis culicivorax TaxID=13658 RepID=A0A915JYF4_ROMCU
MQRRLSKPFKKYEAIQEYADIDDTHASANEARNEVAACLPSKLNMETLNKLKNEFQEDSISTEQVWINFKHFESV